MVGWQEVVPGHTADAPVDEAASSREASSRACRHCGRSAGGDDRLCSERCRSLHRLLVDEGLERYYELRGAPRPPPAEAPGDRAWLAPLARKIASTEFVRRVALDVRGLHSGGCAWLIEELFLREPGRLQIAIDPARSRAELWVTRGFSIERFVGAVERFGYRLVPERTQERRIDAVHRLALCAALAGFAIALRAAEASAGAAAGLLDGVAAGLGPLALWIGGEELVRPARRALGRRDWCAAAAELPPILAVACAAAAWGWTAAALLAGLCASGRLIEDWMLARERRRGSDASADGLLCRRIAGERVDVVSCRRIRRGDELLLAPGDVLAVDAILSARSDGAELAEAERPARRYAAGERVPAGAWNAGSRPIRVAAAGRFSLAALLPRADGASCAAAPHAAQLVLLAAAGAAAWALRGGGARAFEVAAAVLLAGSPAALGVAVARERVEAGLRQSGLLVRRADFFERARAVRRVLVDEIGTFTEAGLELRFPEALHRLSEPDRAALDHLAAHGRHPTCRAVRRALARIAPFPLGDGAVRVDGGGIETELDGARYRLDAPGWSIERGAGGLGFWRDGRLLAWLVTDEAVRAGARAELEALADDGIQVLLLTEKPARARELAGRIGLACELGAVKPGEAGALEGDALVIADAAVGARVAGAPAGDRPLGAAAADFLLLGPGLAPVAGALRGARELAELCRRIRLVAGAAGACAAVLALAGAASPWLVGAAMPLGALAIAAGAKPQQPQSGRKPTALQSPV
jgi:P-type Cu2+ transporter